MSNTQTVPPRAVNRRVTQPPSTPLWARAWRSGKRAAASWTRKESATVAFLDRLMERYTTQHLSHVKPAQFEAKLRSRIGQRDSGQELEVGVQREQALIFRWGHDHDFGSFRLDGEMKDRHTRVLAEFIDAGGLPRDLRGLSVLEIGCWTGGMSLLLAAMGAEVVAVEEVKQYAECVDYLRHSFGVPNLSVLHRSLYELTDPALQDAFDWVLLSGVLYHVTDPIVALRIVFNSLKDGATCVLETTGHRSSEPHISFARRRWNWFDLAPAALEQMLVDVGFGEVRVGGVTADDRLYASATRTAHREMRRDGLSHPTLR